MFMRETFLSEYSKFYAVGTAAVEESIIQVLLNATRTEMKSPSMRL